MKQAEMFPAAIQYEKKTTYFAGPLPSPDTLHQYNEIEPGAADRIFGMAEREMEHRHRMEAKLLDTHSRNSTLGVLSGFLIGLSAIGGGVYGMSTGADLAGAGLALSGLAALVGVFVYQKKSEKSE